MKIHFPQPADVWRFGVFVAHRQIVLRSLPLMEETWELSADEAGNPVHHKDLAAGEPFGLVQHCDGVFHIADAVEQGHRGGVLGTQQTDRAQVKSPLRITAAWPEFVETRGEEFGAFRRLVGIGVCRHLRNSTLARAAGCENYLTTVVLELREADGVMRARVTGSSAELELPLGYATVGDRVRVAIRAGDILLSTERPVEE